MIKTESGDTVYENEIETLFLEYCELHNIDLENDSIKPSKGNAIWKYIYNILFKPDKNTVRYNNKNSKLDYGNIDLLNDIADIYIDLCFDHGIPQSRYGFSRLTGISEDELLRWNKEESRGGSDGATSSHCVLVKKIDSARRAFVRDKLMENPVGQMAIANNDKETGLLYAANEMYPYGFSSNKEEKSIKELALKRYKSKIRKIAQYHYDKQGREGVTGWSESGTSVSYPDSGTPSSYLRGIIPIAKVI